MYTAMAEVATGEPPPPLPAALPSTLRGPLLPRRRLVRGERTGANATLWSVSALAGTAALAWISVAVDHGVDWEEYAFATALLAASGGLGAWIEQRRLRAAAALGPIVFLLALGLLRDSAGGSTSGVGAIAVAPAFYVALTTAGVRQLAAVVLGLAAFYLAPIALVGGVDYPNTQYRSALLSVCVAAIIGLTTQRLVGQARSETKEAQLRGRMLEGLSRVVRDLYSSTAVRSDVCEAARRVGDASVAALFELSPDGAALRCSAQAGFDSEATEISLDEPSALREAFLSGESILVAEDVHESLASREMWIASGCPRAVLYEPLVRDRAPIGVLVVGWQVEVKAAGPRVTVVELLAHEATSVIVRGDTMSELADIASTDALTGLANRRTWDVQLARASRSTTQRFIVAMFDLDHFKEYNDTHGHPAGDRLLKETASLWREQLRAGDLLARIGGEEFGLLLTDCDTEHALEVIERLRGAIWGDRTCSAGYAERRPSEPASTVVARADEALYAAKQGGRDRACCAGG